MVNYIFAASHAIDQAGNMNEDDQTREMNDEDQATDMLEDDQTRGMEETEMDIREAPFNLSPPLCGHCPNSNYTPPPHSNGHPGALFFRRDFTILPFLPFFLPFFYHFL